MPRGTCYKCGRKCKLPFRSHESCRKQNANQGNIAQMKVISGRVDKKNMVSR